MRIDEIGKEESEGQSDVDDRPQSVELGAWHGRAGDVVVKWDCLSPKVNILAWTVDYIAVKGI